MKRYLHKLLSEVLANMFADGQISALPQFELEAAHENFGDYSTNVAFSIAKSGKFNAIEVGEIIARELKATDYDKAISDIKIVNGFINISLSKEKKSDYVLSLQKQIEPDQIGAGQKIVFEYSSPNTNKPLHIGHTRNDVYGVANINLLKVLGYKVISCEVINDRGIHIMKSMLMYMKYGQGKTPQSEHIKSDYFVGKYYAMFAAENEKLQNQIITKENAKTVKIPPTTLELEAQELLQKWEAGDKEVRKLWKQMNDWFYEGVKQTYELEGSHFDSVQHESDIYDKGRELILEGVKKGIFQQEEDGSVSVDLTNVGLDKKYLLRKDGTTIYITQDLYLWDLRNREFKPNMALVTTSSEQAYHFNVLKQIFKLLQYPWADSFYHLPYEHVYLGKNKMSSRAGNVVSADDLLETVKGRVRDIMDNSQKIKASSDNKELVESIAFAAIKYGYLKFDRNTKIYFDTDETAAIEGNTGPYLQYSHARIKSVLNKAGKFKNSGMAQLEHPSELNLIRHLLFYTDVIVSAGKEFKPNLICNYLFELSSKFNTFYDQVSILSAESEQLKEQRLSLIASVAKVLEHGLALLGIKAPEEI